MINLLRRMNNYDVRLVLQAGDQGVINDVSFAGF